MFLFDNKNSLFEFQFLSFSFLSLFFSFLFLLILSLFMFLLFSRTLLMFTLIVSSLLICSFLFFLVEQFLFKKNTVSFFPFPRPSCFIQSPFSLSFFISFCEPAFSVSSPFCFVFFSFFSEQKTFSSNIPKTLSLKFFGFWKMSNIVFHHLLHYHFIEKNGFERLSKDLFFTSVCFGKNLISFFGKWAIQKKVKTNPDLLFWQSPEFWLKKLVVFFGKHVV